VQLSTNRSERLLSLGQIALGVVHDLKNVLLHPLGLQLQRIERALDAKEPEKARAAIAAMRNVLKDGLEAIDRMQQFTRPGAQPVRTRIDVENIVWRATEIARAYARTASAMRDIEITYQPSKAKKIDADGFELLAALVNVLFNAVDAVAERGGKVTVRTGLLMSMRRVWFEIVDDGPGMTPEVRERIFEPFYTTKSDGIGLGLTMVKACVDDHAGTIAIESVPGTGTTFRIELPMP
jgi:signal transduction histidine kinase